MKKRTIYITILSLLAVVFGGFYLFYLQKPSVNTTPESSVERNTAQEATSTQTTGRLTEETDQYSIDVAYPESSDVGTGEVSSFLDTYIEEFKIQAREDVPQLEKGRGVSVQYALDGGVEKHRTSEYISYVVMLSAYTGGVNANQTVSTFTYSAETRKRLRLSDIVEEGDREIFMNILRRRLYDTNNVSADEDNLFANTINGLSFHELSNFYITESAIVILFSKYEVAPGAAGIVSASIPRSQL